jgi:signal transduction histidine kinase
VLGDRARNKARIEVEFEEEIPSLWCQSGKLSQVFMNIIVNAVQATELRWPETEDRRVEVQLKGLAGEDAETVALEVRIRDNGTGMDEVTRQRIFDPFYTTKDIGKGTGLGLSIVKGILDDHGAEIMVESTPEVGTCFILRFPLHAPGASQTEAA